jgi:hypothetical protein
VKKSPEINCCTANRAKSPVQRKNPSDNPPVKINAFHGKTDTKAKARKDK